MASEKIKKMQLNIEAIGWLLKPLKLEKQSDYQNKAVAGGLGRWLDRLKGKLVTQAGLTDDQSEALIAPLTGYDQATYERRKAAIIEVGIEYKKLLAPKRSGHVDPGIKSREVISPAPGSIKALNDSIQYIKGIGPKRSQLLKKLGIRTVSDLIHYYPRDWQDRSRVKPVNQLTAGEKALVMGKVKAKGTFSVRRGLKLTKVIIEDQTGHLEATWFNQPYIKDRFEVGQTVIAYGKIEFFRQWQMANPETEIIEDDLDNRLHTGRLVPIYGLTEKLSQRVLRQLVFGVLKALPADYPEVLPLPVCRSLNLISGRQAIAHIHFPETQKTLAKAKERLIYEELILQQLAVNRIRRSYQAGQSLALAVNGPVLTGYIKSLPFDLTGAQEKARQAITDDLGKERPMHRLLQGDVGSGKTVLAVIAALAAIDSGVQAALMAPTEILAYQHYKAVERLLAPLGVKCCLLTSAMKVKERRDCAEEIAHGEIQFVIGTHALTQEKVIFDRLAVVVIDEQHRFGVEQRQLLRSKGKSPHVLVMTATPIPRTLALTAYGDLDVTTIDELPPGRQPIKTTWLSKKKSRQAYEHIIKEVEKGRQAYIIFPLIDESEKLDLKALTKEFDQLSKFVFKNIPMGLLHGKMKSDEKDQVMNAFKQGTISILASTTVVEVGVDVPNATVIIIEEADRFGLAALHQLRGRVGRSRFLSACYLIADPKTDEGKKRMAIMENTTNGFQLAEQDLALRGPGEFFGLRQHGLPDLKLANIVRDSDKIVVSRKIVEKILENDEKLEKKENNDLKKAYFERYYDKEKHAQTG